MFEKVEDKVIIACLVTGYCASVSKVDGYYIKSLKNWMSSHRKEWNDVEFKVVHGSRKMKILFQEHANRIDRNEEHFDFRVVGVNSKRIVDLCMLHKKIRPLHICQEIAFNIHNTEVAVRDNDRELVEEYQSERLKLYVEACRDWNLNMTQLNDLIWEEFDHIINDYKFL